MWEMVKDGNVKCWIDLSDLPRGKRNGKECNDWKNSIGCKIGVRYKWLQDEVEERLFSIVDYDKNTRKLTLKWKNEVYETRTGDLQRGRCGRIFDKYTSEFKYEIGEVINGLTIIDRYYKQDKRGQQYKWYKYQCEKGHVHEIVEGSLKQGNSCPYCSNKKVLEGYNDIATTNPDLVRYFSNPDDAKKYTYKSKQKVLFKCPFCGKEKKMVVCNFVNQGLSCSNCSDGISIPEKFMSNILHSIGCNFKHQLTRVDFDWIRNFKYDFYLPDYNIIIETHGKQHYKETGENSNWDDLEDVRKNDNEKLKLASENGYELNKNYFVIDCSNSDFKFLTEQIKRALSIVRELYNIDFSVNYEECYIKSQNSIFHLVVEIANKHPEFTSQQITDELKEKFGYQLHFSTICSYLRKSNELVLTNYKNKNDENKRQVICLNTRKVYESTMEAKRQTGTNNIWECCSGKLKSSGVIDGKPSIWLFVEDYEKLSDEEIEKIKNQELSNRGRAKEVICITTEKKYESARDAERKTGISYKSISACCCGKCKNTKDKNGNKLVWMFYDKYLESLK